MVYLAADLVLVDALEPSASIGSKGWHRQETRTQQRVEHTSLKASIKRFAARINWKKGTIIKWNSLPFLTSSLPSVTRDNFSLTFLRVLEHMKNKRQKTRNPGSGVERKKNIKT